MDVGQRLGFDFAPLDREVVERYGRVRGTGRRPRRSGNRHYRPFGRFRTSPMTHAGLPATTAKSGTSRVTRAAAPTIAPTPIVTSGRIVALLPIEARRQT